MFKAALLIDVSKHDLHHTAWMTEMTLHEQFNVCFLAHMREQRRQITDKYYLVLT